MIHFSRCAALVLVLAGVSFGAAPATSPATSQPAYAGTPEQAAARVAETKARLEKERAALNEQIAGSADVKKVQVELDAASAIYEKAKQSGTVSDRMTTGAAANKIKARLTSIKDKMAAASGVPAAIADAQAAERDLAQAKVQAAKAKADQAAAAAKEAPDPFWESKIQAVKEHRIIIGMTLEQVKASWPDAVWVPKGENEDGKIFEVTHPLQVNDLNEVYDLTFLAGKLTVAYRH